MKTYQTLLFLFFFGIISAQNLVKNPSFENANRGPWTYGEFHGNVINWSSPTFGTPDYYSLRSRKMNEENYRGTQKPKTGDCYAGLYLFATKNNHSYREYVQAHLKKKLTKNATYSVSYYISLSETSSHSVDSIHTLFSSKHIGLAENTSSRFGRKHVNPKPKDTNLELKTTERDSFKSKVSYIKTKSQLSYDWLKVSFTYKANGFEEFIVFGNLNTNNNTNIIQHNPIEERAFSYYYIDDIEIIEIEKAPIKTETITFQPEKTYTFKNVLFDFDRAKLIDVSIEELNKLYKFLEANKNLTIEIYGHTDTVGLDSRNKELSLLRAKAVSMYLRKKGLNANRIKWFGFGAEQPIVKNNTEENRAKNRRVEFKLIK